jgi:lipopolysaccharide export system permease protein
MKKIDLLILKTLFRPFILAFFLIIFIMLMQTVLINFEDLIGKGLGWATYYKIFAYLSISVVQYATPIATMIGALLGFNKLTTNNEIISFKTAGVSSLRIMLPGFVFSFVIFFSLIFFNGYLVPRYSQKAYILFYDLFRKKPSLNIKEGVFYNGIPNYSIKINQKLSDNKSVKDIMIYDHTGTVGDTNLTIADSGNIYTIIDDSYLVIELFNGKSYIENYDKGTNKFYKTSFGKSKRIISLEDLKIIKSPDTLFSGKKRFQNYNKLWENLTELKGKLRKLKIAQQNELILKLPQYKSPFKKEPYTGSLLELIEKSSLVPSLAINKSIIEAGEIKNVINRQIKTQRQERLHIIECYMAIYLKISLALNCILTFAIAGALGILSGKNKLALSAFTASILLLFYYLVENYAQDYVRQESFNTLLGMFISNLFLVPFAIYFLNKVQKDSELPSVTNLIPWWFNPKTK